MDNIEFYWNKFLKEKNLDENTKYIEAFHFTNDKELANELLELVLIGKKRATTGPKIAWELENAELPKTGDYSIVTDWEGNPRCVIQTKEVTVLPFRDVTYDICKREGEDECLETWREGHIRFITEGGKELGYEFSEDMPVVFEDFELVYIF